MFVAEGARARLSSSEREQFIAREWPAVRARMEQLGINPAELLERY
jgi:GntR family transcriptional regulator